LPQPKSEDMRAMKAFIPMKLNLFFILLTVKTWHQFGGFTAKYFKTQLCMVDVFMINFPV